MQPRIVITASVNLRGALHLTDHTHANLSTTVVEMRVGAHGALDLQNVVTVSQIVGDLYCRIKPRRNRMLSIIML